MKSNAINALNRQYGGTILGIIIGLVIGLTIAVVVALMITKTSTPFTNKLGINKADTPAVQLTDPNKPLYGSSAKEILASASKQTDTASGENAPVSQPYTARPTDTTKPEIKIEGRSDAKNVKPAESVVAKNDADSPAYYLQVGAFRDASDAEGSRAKLALLGVDSRIISSEGDNLYRVRIGPFDQTESMNRMRTKLSENSIDVAVIKTPK